MDKKMFLGGLIYSCPLIDASANCPIEKFRKSSVDKLIERVNDLKDNDILKITQDHVRCHKRRNIKP
jgi:hypothetical protein